MGKGSAKQVVDEYSMSIHLGACWGPCDAITGLFVGEKVAWEGEVTTESAIYVSSPSLFGGPKTEGGVGGVMYYLPGGPDQVMPDSLATRYGMTSASSPGYRGVASVFFTGLDSFDVGSLDTSGGGDPGAGVGGDGSSDPGTGSGGGVGCVWIGATLADGTPVESALVDADARVLDHAGTGVEVAPILAMKRITAAPCVTLVTFSGIENTVSKNTPFTTQDGRVISVMDCCDMMAPVEDENGFRWERIVAVLEAGRRDVMLFDFGGRTFGAGDVPGRSVYTHNKVIQ